MKKKQIWELIILFVCIMLFSLFKIIFNSFSYDTDLLFLNHKGIMDSWIGIGRYGLVLLKYIFHLYSSVNLRLFNIITYINVFIYSILFLYFIKLGKKKEINILKDILTLFVIISSPIMLEQYNFTLQSPEVSFGFVLMVVSFITTYFYLKDKKIMFAIITILLNTVVFGIYQSFVNLYIIGVLISLYKLNKENRKENNKFIVKSIVIFIISVVCYLITNKFVINYFDITTSSYISEKIMWLSSFKEALFGIVKDVIKVLIGYGHILNLSYTITIGIILYYIFKENRKVNYKNFYLIMLLISPFILNLITGSRMAYRSLFSFPFMISFIFSEFYDFHKYIKYLLIIIVCSQIINSELLLYSDYKRYINDIAIGEKIYSDCNADENTVIVMKGIEKTEENIQTFKGEVMSYSFFEWSNNEPNVAYPRVYNFMLLHNMKLKYSMNEFNNYDKYIIEEEYPNNGYYIKDKNVCYVNLGK